MNADDLAAALVNGASGWMVLSVAAVLPMIWTFTLVMHFARPAIIRFLQSLTLRFGGDVWWLSYVLFRDALLVITLGLGMLFFMPNLYFVEGLPITAPLSVLVLFWALCVKIVRDPDEDPQAFRLFSILLVVGFGPLHRPADLRARSGRPGVPGRPPECPHQQREPGRRTAAVLAEPRAVRAHGRGDVRPSRHADPRSEGGGGHPWRGRLTDPWRPAP